MEASFTLLLERTINKVNTFFHEQKLRIFQIDEVLMNYTTKTYPVRYHKVRSEESRVYANYLYLRGREAVEIHT